MSQEFEAAAAASVGGFLRFRRHKDHALPPGSLCANCATPLQGPWCHECGQLGEDFHRSTWHLLVEVFEGLLHFDGRLWRTLPDLFVRPARLTRSYLDGHRAPQVPPLRLFLVVLLLVFFTGSIGGKDSKVITANIDNHGHVMSAHTETFAEMTPEQRQKAEQSLSKAQVEIGGVHNVAAEHWLTDRLKRALEDPERMKMAMEQWSERFAFLMLPIAAALLSLLFVFQRRFYVFDHTIFSLHSLSAMGLLLSVDFLASPLIGDAAGMILLAAPVHLFVHMRGVYRTSIFGTLMRMALLSAGSLIGFVFLMLGLVWVALNTLAG